MTSPFRLKQFTIHQDRCAMKVGTDGILIGAWASTSLPNRILDIGTGTGLIALMLAQRYPDAIVDAIEIDLVAAQQANENSQASPFADRLIIHTCSLDMFQNESTHHRRYSLIVANPPWFIDSMKSGNASRDMARHTDTLSHDQLLWAALKLLDSDGQFAVILPAANGRDLITKASQIGLHCCRYCDVHPTADKPAKRLMMQFARKIQTEHFQPEKLIVETSLRHVYTQEYQALTKDFYLRF